MSVVLGDAIALRPRAQRRDVSSRWRRVDRRQFAGSHATGHFDRRGVRKVEVCAHALKVTMSRRRERVDAEVLVDNQPPIAISSVENNRFPLEAFGNAVTIF